MPKDLPLGLQTALHQIGIDSLYQHQIEALTQLRLGKDLSIVTSTASGKTLCYNLAILESCLNNPFSTAVLNKMRDCTKRWDCSCLMLFVRGSDRPFRLERGI